MTSFSPFEMLEGAKSMDAGAATIASAGAAVGVTILFLVRKPLLGAVRHFFGSQPQDEPISRRVSDYAQQLDISNVQPRTAGEYLEEFGHALEWKCYLHGIEALPGGHSWLELAKAVISTGVSPDLTDVEIIAYAYCALLERGPGNVLMTEALKILQLWQHGLPIS